LEDQNLDINYTQSCGCSLMGPHCMTCIKERHGERSQQGPMIAKSVMFWEILMVYQMISYQYQCSPWSPSLRAVFAELRRVDASRCEDPLALLAGNCSGILLYTSPSSSLAPFDHKARAPPTPTASPHSHSQGR